MNDYTWPSVYFSYFFFALSLGLAVYFFARSWKQGYWGSRGEEVKYRVFEEEENTDAEARRRGGRRGEKQIGARHGTE